MRRVHVSEDLPTLLLPIPATASLSASSLPSSPLCPLTHSTLTTIPFRCAILEFSLSTCRHKSRFATGSFLLFNHPLSFHFFRRLFNPFTQYSLSLFIIMTCFFRVAAEAGVLFIFVVFQTLTQANLPGLLTIPSKASIIAVSSALWFVWCFPCKDVEILRGSFFP